MSREDEEVREEAPPTEQETPAEEPAVVAASPAAQKPAVEPGRAERPAADSSERPQRRFIRRRKVCAFCVENVQVIDYKDPGKLRRYLSDRGRIEPRRKTGTCAKHQRWLSVALKRARHLALLPYTPEHIRLTGMFAPRR